MEPVPNSCLISNSTLSFSDLLLRGCIKTNPYALFDLSNISQVILFNEKIYTLADAALISENLLFSRLKDENLIEEIDEHGHKEIIPDINYSYRGGLFPFEIDLDTISGIFSDIFPLDKEYIKEIISKRRDWANKNWSSPDWSRNMVSFLKSSVNSESDIYLKKEDAGTINKFFEDPQAVSFTDFIPDLILQILLRIPMYMGISSTLGLNYLPDSVRAPLVSYIHRIIKHQTIQYTSVIIKELEDERRKKIEQFNMRTGLANSFEIEIPAALGTIIRECKKPDEFLSKAIELRHSKNIENFRNHLNEVNEAILDGDTRRFEKLENKYHEVRGMQGRSMIAELIPSASAEMVAEPSLSVSANVNSVILYAIKYFKKRRLLFLDNLNKTFEEIRDLNDEFEKIFGGKLSSPQLEKFRTLRAYQKDYLPG